VGTLLERFYSIVTEEEDQRKEEDHVKEALNTCGYPDWTVKKSKE